MYEQNLKLLHDLIQRREPIYGIMAFMEDTIEAMRADIGIDAHQAIYNDLEAMASALDSIHKQVFESAS
ncbi:MAG: hypothetical protein KDK37_14135 [Leptospiraceae bacterium]|nr:hypothetical protein [Leptospiraceae bacterium]MCB1305421.1 hypothetical protein [Leptospiraceae bacterium]